MEHFFETPLVGQNNPSKVDFHSKINKTLKNWLTLSIRRLPKLFGQFTANTWRAEYADGIFDKSDIEVKGRTAFDNTVDSNLQEILKENKIEKVYFVGFTTDHCVAETMDTLISDGYECILVSDCTAARNRKIQKKIENKYTSVNSKQILEEISD